MPTKNKQHGRGGAYLDCAMLQDGLVARASKSWCTFEKCPWLQTLDHHLIVKKGTYILLSVGLCLLHANILAQTRCGYDQQMSAQEKADPGSTMRFERWLSKKMKKTLTTSPTQRISEVVYTLPIVVHIIHRGGPMGTNSNLSNEKIMEQLRMINEDFNRQNKDATRTPSEFLPVAASCQIAFVLATQDPYGLPTSGITRTQQQNMSINTREDLMQIIAWPTTDYLNLWIIPPDTGGVFDGLLGFSQFPLSERSAFNTTTSSYPFDGIVIKSNKIGVQGDSYGRTLTHEIGHFLGLRHVWGDGGCTQDDFCEDTPRANASAENCTPKHSCGSRDMIENYMDYSPDSCMNIFTTCQKKRMRTVLEHDPIRRQLLVSKGKENIAITQNDAGIRRIIHPKISACQERFFPEVEIANYGRNTLSDVEVALKINGREREKKIITAPLSSYAFTSLVFDEYTLPTASPAYHTFSFEVVGVRGVPDIRLANNSQTITVMRHENFTVDSATSFDEASSQWLLTPSSLGRAEIVTSARTGESALKFSFSTQTAHYGKEYELRSPIINMRNYENTDLTFTFRYSYAARPPDDDLITGLRAVVYERCGTQNNKVHEVLSSFGNRLPTTTLPIQHTLPAQDAWRTMDILLTSFKGLEYIQLALLARDGRAGDLYIDDVGVARKEAYDHDVGIADVQVSYTNCGSIAAYYITLKNYGKRAQDAQPIVAVEIPEIANFTPELITISPVSTWQNNTTWLSFSTTASLPDGAYTLKVGLAGDLLDEYTKNNTDTAAFYIHSRLDHPPTLENFEGHQARTAQWYRPINEIGNQWEVVARATATEQTGHATRAALYGLSEVATYWLMSPIYDFSRLSAATLSFEVAYARRGALYDELQVLASTDCGEHFTHVLYTKGGEELAIKETYRRWVPESPSDWREEVVDLTELVGQVNIQLAFVVRTTGGNDLYVDNIEIFDRNSVDKIATEKEQVRLYPNPATDGLTYLSFHLLEKSTISLRLYNIAGQEVARQDHPNTLNQIYSVSLPQKAHIYILQVLKNNRNLRSFRALGE